MKSRRVYKVILALILGFLATYLGTYVILSKHVTGHWFPGSLTSTGIEMPKTAEELEEYHQKSLEKKEENFVFVGRVIFESGDPVPDAVVKLSLHAVKSPKGSSHATAGAHELGCATDENGFLVVDAKGRFLLITNIDGPGELLFEKDFSERDLRQPNTLGYNFSRSRASGYYLPVDGDPAVFVLVRPNEIIKAWLSRGGKDFHPGINKEYINTPTRPSRPSVPLIETEDG